MLAASIAEAIKRKDFMAHLRNAFNGALRSFYAEL
jgi:hypothetical protein